MKFIKLIDRLIIISILVFAFYLTSKFNSCKKEKIVYKTDTLYNFKTDTIYKLKIDTVKKIVYKTIKQKNDTIYKKDSIKTYIEIKKEIPILKYKVIRNNFGMGLGINIQDNFYKTINLGFRYKDLHILYNIYEKKFSLYYEIWKK